MYQNQTSPKYFCKILLYCTSRFFFTMSYESTLTCLIIIYKFFLLKYYCLRKVKKSAFFSKSFRLDMSVSAMQLLILCTTVVLIFLLLTDIASYSMVESCRL